MSQRLADLLAAEPPELVIGPVPARIAQLLAARIEDARRRLIAGLDDRRYITLLNDLDALVAAAAGSGRVEKREVRHLARRAVRRADRRLAAADAGGAGPSRDERFHEARKAYKRARYATELATPVAGPPAAKLADRITELQDVLGAHQDAIVTAELLRDYGLRAFADGENAFTYGLLHARQAEHGRTALASLPRVRRRAARPKVRRWLS